MVIFVWIPVYTDINGNEIADSCKRDQQKHIETDLKNSQTEGKIIKKQKILK